MATQKFNKTRAGYSLIEILVAIFVFISISTALIYLLVETGVANIQEKDRLKAITLAEEGIEATRNIRDSGWGNLPTGTYGLTVNNNRWELSGESDTDPSGRFQRRVSISEISTDRYLITSTVTYNFSGLRNISVSSVTHLTNWRKVTEEDEIPWEEPEVIKTVSTADIIGNKDPRDIYTNGDYVYLVTEEANANDPEVFIFNIADIENIFLAGTYKVGAKINAVHVVGNYIYLATTKDDEEFIALRADDPANIVKVGSVDTPRNYDATNIFVLDGYVYLLTQTSVVGQEFSIIDVTNPEVIPASPIGALTMGVTGYSVYADGNIAFIATDSDSEEIIAVNIENKASPIKIGSFDLSGSADGLAIETQGGKIYIGTAVNSAQYSEFYIIDYSLNENGNINFTPSGQLKIGGKINALQTNIAGNNVFLATNLTSKEFFVVDISNPSTPIEKSSIDLADEAVGIGFNGNHAFIASIANSQELIIIEP